MLRDACLKVWLCLSDELNIKMLRKQEQLKISYGGFQI
jgi:hypothetical protein